MTLKKLYRLVALISNFKKVRKLYKSNQYCEDYICCTIDEAVGDLVFTKAEGKRMKSYISNKLGGPGMTINEWLQENNFPKYRQLREEQGAAMREFRIKWLTKQIRNLERKLERDLAYTEVVHA